MKYVKNQFYETHYRSSTIPMGTMAGLGTIERILAHILESRPKLPSEDIRCLMTSVII